MWPTWQLVGLREIHSLVIGLQMKITSIRCSKVWRLLQQTSPLLEPIMTTPLAGKLSRIIIGRRRSSSKKDPQIVKNDILHLKRSPVISLRCWIKRVVMPLSWDLWWWRRKKDGSDIRFFHLLETHLKRESCKAENRDNISIARSSFEKMASIFL